MLILMILKEFFLISDEGGFSPCDSAPCEHGGHCINVSPSDFKCTCLADFTGKMCQNKMGKIIILTPFLPW